MSSYNVYIEEISPSDLGDSISFVLIDQSTGLTMYFDLVKNESNTYEPCECLDSDPLSEEEIMQENLAAIVNEKLAAGERLVDRYDNNYQPFVVGI